MSLVVVSFTCLELTGITSVYLCAATGTTAASYAGYGQPAATAPTAYGQAGKLGDQCACSCFVLIWAGYLPLGDIDMQSVPSTHYEIVIFVIYVASFLWLSCHCLWVILVIGMLFFFDYLNAFCDCVSLCDFSVIDFYCLAVFVIGWLFLTSLCVSLCDVIVFVWGCPCQRKLNVHSTSPGSRGSTFSHTAQT